MVPSIRQGRKYSASMSRKRYLKVSSNEDLDRETDHDIDRL